MSNRCSQMATQRVLAWSKTFTSLVPSKDMFETYVFMAGSRSFAASEHRAHGLQDSGTACEVVFCNHAAHLVSESPCILRQDLRVQVPYGSASHIILRRRLLPGVFAKFLDGGEPPFLIQKGKGKSWPCLPSPCLGTGAFQGPGPLEFGLHTRFHLFSPSLAVSHSTRLHWSRCIRAGGTDDRSLLHRWLLGGSLRWRSASHPNTRPAGAYPWAFGPPVRLLLRLTWLQLRPLGQWCPNQVGALLDLASLDKQPVEVAPSFYPEGKL